jgi:hypothetical protein
MLEALMWKSKAVQDVESDSSPLRVLGSGCRLSGKVRERGDGPILRKSWQEGGGRHIGG